jgi:hypothetical protein
MVLVEQVDILSSVRGMILGTVVRVAIRVVILVKQMEYGSTLVLRILLQQRLLLLKLLPLLLLRSLLLKLLQLLLKRHMISLTNYLMILVVMGLKRDSLVYIS